MQKIREIFVFGSNLRGRHGGGSALHALNHHGAVLGQATGLQGESYAIPTKDEYLQTLSLEQIAGHVREFIIFAGENPGMHFNIVAIGCGLAGLTPEQIAPMFAGVPANCFLPHEFMKKEITS